MFRSALVALKPEDTSEALLRYAVELARRYSVRLTGIAILDRDLAAPPEPVPLGGMAFKAEMDERRIARMQEQVASAISTFSRHCASAGIPYDAIAVSEHLYPEIARSVQRHDLLLTGHTSGTTASGRPHDPSVLDDILRRSPRPALVVPALPAAGASTVVVAYDASMQAARSLESFVASGFEADATVHVVSFDGDLAAAEATASLACDYLASHDYQAVASPRAIGANDSISGMILEACREHQSRLLVMGIHGKSTIREFLFGSVTKKMLAEANVPLFLNH